jgi:hypothetical protein
MAARRREERRRLALDVRGLVWYSGKFDAEKYIRTGSINERKSYPLPNTPAIIAAREEMRRERERLGIKPIRGRR